MIRSGVNILYKVPCISRLKLYLPVNKTLIFVKIVPLVLNIYIQANTLGKGMNPTTGWNDKIVVRKKTTLQLYFKTFIEKINSDNMIM